MRMLVRAAEQGKALEKSACAARNCIPFPAEVGWGGVKGAWSKKRSLVEPLSHHTREVPASGFID